MRFMVVKKKTVVIALLLCVITFTGIGFAGGLAVGTGEGVQASGGADSYYIPMGGQAVALAAGDPKDLSVPEIVSYTADSVVEITTESVTTAQYMRQYITEGAGSGVIVDAGGYIVTNNHVIEGASKITVRLRNGLTYDATLIGTDSTTDIALLKIEATNLTAAVYGDSSSLLVGERAVVIGNPLGELGGTVTQGIISALDREITIDGKAMNLLQTDAAVNPGNSGGGLFDGSGKLIGVINAKSTGTDVEGLGFAIPINDAAAVIEQLRTNGYVKGRIDLGMTFVDITSIQTAFRYGVTQTGVYIQKVNQNSNAQKAGLQAGDLVVSVGGTKVSSASQITSILAGYNVGDTVTWTIMRTGMTGETSFVLTEYSPH